MGDSNHLFIVAAIEMIPEVAQIFTPVKPVDECGVPNVARW